MKRIELLDLWRTIAIVCMVIYHLLYDFAIFGLISWQEFFSPGLNALQKFICCSFIIVSGISSRFSKNNLKRGVVVFLFSIVISIGGFAVGEPILFGVLSFLGCAMIIYGVSGKYIEKASEASGFFMPAVLLALFFITKRWTESAVVEVGFLFPLGFINQGFHSSDYFPILPWIFLFLFGTWFGGLLKKSNLPKWVYMSVPKGLTWPGRHSLLIYMLHQPVLYGITMILTRF